jgi:hypothetical protein
MSLLAAGKSEAWASRLPSALHFSRKIVMNTRLSFIASLLLALAASAANAVENEVRSQDRFVATWANEDQETRGMTKLEVKKDGDEWTIRAWGACEPDDCDWGVTKLNLLGDAVDARDLPYALATWDHDFETTHVVLRIEAATLIVETYGIFKDNSGRSNIRSVDRMKRAYSVQK